MKPSESFAGHWAAILLALLVTFFWSTSWILIKVGLRSSLPVLTFAGLRYSLAFMVLLPVVLINRAHRKTLRDLPRGQWVLLACLGLVFYTLTQGAQFVSLVYLPAATLTLILNFSPIVVAMMTALLGSEGPSRAQWCSILLSVSGAVLYFAPLSVPEAQIFGFAAALVCLLANSGASLLGRHVNSRGGLPPVVVTTVSMGAGGLLLLFSGVILQGFGSIDPEQWLIILWLAVVNTALAFTLWNYSLRTLTAVESSIINGMMLPQIALFAWLFLEEPLNGWQITGLVLVGIGVLALQTGQKLFDCFRNTFPRRTRGAS